MCPVFHVPSWGLSRWELIKPHNNAERLVLLTDKEPEIAEINLKRPKFTWVSIQQSWNVSSGLPEDKARGVFP